MKRRNIYSTILGLVLLFSAHTATAQIQLGAGLAIADEFGVQVGGVYGINENIRAAVDFTYYFVDDVQVGTETLSTNVFEINANGHYLFLTEESYRVYGLAGLHFGISSIEEITVFGQTIGGSESEIGLNIGSGAEYDLGFANAYSELKYTIGGLDGLLISAGLRFPL